MALAKKKSNSSRLVIIGIVVVVVVGIGYVLFRQFFLNDGVGTNGAANTNHGKSVITNFGETILNDPRFTTLKSYDVSINTNAETDGGQANPFQ